MALVIPVIHHIYTGLSLENAALAHRAGCHGVFLIQMQGYDAMLDEPVRAIKDRFPGFCVGVNRLSARPDEAIAADRALGVNATWSDAPGVSSAGFSATGQRALKAFAEARRADAGCEFFASVAFKYQKPEPDPAKAACAAAAWGMIATTSGPGTGQAPDIDKIVTMRAALNAQVGRHAKLAIASGMTPDNVGLFAPHLDYILVATGISANEHIFDERLLDRFMTAANARRKDS